MTSEISIVFIQVIFGLAGLFTAVTACSTFFGNLMDVSVEEMDDPDGGDDKVQAISIAITKDLSKIIANAVPLLMPLMLLTRQVSVLGLVLMYLCVYAGMSTIGSIEYLFKKDFEDTLDLAHLVLMTGLSFLFFNIAFGAWVIV